MENKNKNNKQIEKEHKNSKNDKNNKKVKNEEQSDNNDENNEEKDRSAPDKEMPLYRILCVEDEPDMLNIMISMLQSIEELNLKIFTARDGVEALELFYKIFPDLIFLDIRGAISKTDKNLLI